MKTPNSSQVLSLDPWWLNCLSDVDAVEPLRRSSMDAPPGFASWLDKHVELRDHSLNLSRRMQEGQCTPNMPLHSSVKCWDEHCIHFIYGFSSQRERDDHAQVHKALAKRDSGFSMGNSPPLPVSEHFPLRAEPFEPPNRTDLGQPTRQVMPLLPPLSLPNLPPESGKSCARFPSESRRGTRKSSGASDAESLLPPLKKTRLSQPRLESIGELRLLRDKGPCMRCKVEREEVRWQSFDIITDRILTDSLSSVMRVSPALIAQPTPHIAEKRSGLRSAVLGKA